MFEPLSFVAITMLLMKSAPIWLPPIRDAFLGKVTERGTDLVIDKGTKGVRSLFRLDEKEQARHLELVLKNALERGQAAFHTPEEQRRYRSIIATLCEGPHSEILRREVTRLFSLSDSPNFTELNEIYNHSLPPSTSSTQVDAAPYLSSFFDAVIAELYADPFFRQQMSDVLRVRAAMSMQRSLTEVVATLRQIGEAVSENYTTEQLEQDVKNYVTHVERALRYLKLVGFVPKDRGNENTDPELNGIYVPLRVALRGRTISKDQAQDSITTLLEQFPCQVLLGGPGSGKSTVTRYLAWSHALANTSLLNLPSSSNTPLLSGKPIPIRIELRRLTEDRRQRPEYDFLSYTTEVLLGRAGLHINRQMFVELLERRTMLLIFDGLDEVATIDERRQLIEEIEHFAQHYPGNRILVTSRPVGYELAPFSNRLFSHALVQEFDDQQIRMFLDRWYIHVLRLSPLLPDDQQELEALYTTLKENPRLQMLARNPLLLTVMAALHRYERLPDRRVLLYDRCADLLLETWAKLRGTHARWKDMKMGKEDQCACVAHLGFVLHKRSQEQKKDSTSRMVDETSSIGNISNDVSTRFMLREIERFLGSQNLFSSVAEQHAEAKRFLELMQVEAGLIVERGTDEGGESLYGFVHRTFQEYFAAVDVYERYQQEEDATIISQFLTDNLHDPHWREVILLLFGKLKRKPATIQLRRIFDGKEGKSRLSRYTNIVQQDLFFACDCLAEEIAVDNELAELIVSRMSDLVKHSPFPSQCYEGIAALGSVMQTRQYSDLGRRALKALFTISDISIRIRTARTLYEYSSPRSEEKQQAIQMILGLVQQSEIPFEQAMGAVHAFYLGSTVKSEEKWPTPQILMVLAQRSDLSIDQAIEVAQSLCWNSLSRSKERRSAINMLMALTQRSDLSLEQTLQIAHALYGYSPSKSKERHHAAEIFLNLTHRTDFSIKQIVQAVKDFRYSIPTNKLGDKQIVQMLLDLFLRTDLSIEQALQIAQTFFYGYGYYRSEQERQQVTQKLLDLFLRTDLSVEQALQIATILYSFSRSEKEQQAVKPLLELARRSDLSIEQALQVARTFYQPYSSREERRQALQMILELTRRSDLSIEQTLQIARTLFEYGSTKSEEKQATQIIWNLIKQPNLSFEQSLQIAQTFYEFNTPESKERQQGLQLIWQLTQHQSYTIDQRLQAATIPLKIVRSDYPNKVQAANYPDRAQAVQMVIALLQRDDAKKYLQSQWQSIRRIHGYEPEVTDIPYIAELAQQELLPTEARDEMYRTLRNLVPQFGNLDEIEN